MQETSLRFQNMFILAIMLENLKVQKEIPGSVSCDPLKVLDILNVHVEERVDQLLLLSRLAREALSIAKDINQVNEALRRADRPDLEITTTVPQMAVLSIKDLGRVNNFVMKMANMGVYDLITQSGDEKSEKQYQLRHPTAEEVAIFHQISGSGDSFEQKGFELGLDRGTVECLYSYSMLPKPAFMRMWAIAPELTESMMKTLLNARKNTYEEEILISYTIMSQLVSENDCNVRRPDGQLDDWYLCR
jgi:hypothetical protein